MRVAKSGSSLAVRLPNANVKSVKLKSGDEIEIDLRGEHIFEVERDTSCERALARLRAPRKPLPKRLRFDREEAKSRSAVLRHEYSGLCLRRHRSAKRSSGVSDHRRRRD